MTTAAIGAIIVFGCTVLGWLFKVYVLDAKPITPSQQIETEIAKHDEDAVNTRLDNNLDRLLHDQGDNQRGTGSIGEAGADSKGSV